MERRAGAVQAMGIRRGTPLSSLGTAMGARTKGSRVQKKSLSLRATRIKRNPALEPSQAVKRG